MKRFNLVPSVDSVDKCCKCSDPAKPPALIKCDQCKRVWCCWECCCEDDGLDHNYSDMIYDYQRDLRPKDRTYPDQFNIVCCFCSGLKRSWEDRE